MCLGCLGFLGVLVFEVNDILEGQTGDQGGGHKMAKIQYGVNPDIFKRAAQKWPKFWVGVKFQHFGLRPKKCF